MLRRLGMDGEELIDEEPRRFGSGPCVDAVLQTTKGRRGGEGQFRVGNAPGGHLERGVGPEGLMVVEILISQSDGDDPLGEHGPLIVDEEERGCAGLGWRR